MVPQKVCVCVLRVCPCWLKAGGNSVPNSKSQSHRIFMSKLAAISIQVGPAPWTADLWAGSVKQAWHGIFVRGRAQCEVQVATLATLGTFGKLMSLCLM